MATFVLYESAVGYALFEIKEYDEIAQSSDKVQEAIRCALPPHLQPSGQLPVLLVFGSCRKILSQRWLNGLTEYHIAVVGIAAIWLVSGRL